MPLHLRHRIPCSHAPAAVTIFSNKSLTAKPNPFTAPDLSLNPFSHSLTHSLIMTCGYLTQGLTTVTMPSKTITSKPPSFTLFAHLPTELRLEIWKLTAQPRVVEVRYLPSSDRCVTTTPAPPLLQVCRESRSEALHSGVYVRAFGTKSHAPSIYFSPALDVLYLPRWGHLGYADTARDFGTFVLSTAQHVHSLAIDHVKPEVRRPWETYSKFCLMRNFPRLREAFLVLADGTQTASSDLDDCGEGSQRGDSDWGQIEFVDPRGNQQEIMRLMENVRESFSCEVGPDCFEMPVWDERLEEVGMETGMGMGTGCCFELVPKSKMACGCRGQQQQQQQTRPPSALS